MFADDEAGTAQHIHFPGEGDVLVAVTIEPEVTLGELTQVWTLECGSDRSLGRPKEWNGESSGFDDFAFKFSNWLSGLGFREMLTDFWRSLHTWATLAAREKVVARGVATASS